MTVSKQVIEILNALCEKIGIVVDWSNENVLPYAIEIMQKIVKYEIATSTVWISIALVFGLITYKIVKFYNKENNSYSVKFWSNFTGIVIAIILIPIIIIQIFDIVKCVTFPEMIIYDFITKNIGN